MLPAFLYVTAATASFSPKSRWQTASLMDDTPIDLNGLPDNHSRPAAFHGYST